MNKVAEVGRWVRNYGRVQPRSVWYPGWPVEYRTRVILVPATLLVSHTRLRQFFHLSSSITRPRKLIFITRGSDRWFGTIARGGYSFSPRFEEIAASEMSIIFLARLAVRSMSAKWRQSKTGIFRKCRYQRGFYWMFLLPGRCACDRSVSRRGPGPLFFRARSFAPRLIVHSPRSWRAVAAAAC